MKKIMQTLTLALTIFIPAISQAGYIPDEYFSLQLSRDQFYKLDLIGDKYDRAIARENQLIVNLSRNVNAINKIPKKTPEQLQSLSISMSALSMAADRKAILENQRSAEMDRQLTPEQIQQKYSNQNYRRGNRQIEPIYQ